ncbi:MAG: LytR C-terminal domain-containing protein [Ignavibacteria bacterium]|nr:LytR C-terminal domain-containing protein [Ignavibacteria bacterium]
MFSNKEGAENKEKSSVKGPLNVLLNISIFVLLVMLGYFIYSGIGKLADSAKEVKTGDQPGVQRLIQVKIYNGCGIKGLGEKVTEYLRKNNFDIIDAENYSSFDVEETLVIDNRGNRENALQTAKVLGVDPKKNVSENINEDYLLDVIVIIGKDYKNLKPFNNQ